MDLDRPVEFLRTNGRAVLSTTRRDGSPQMSPILVAVDGAGRLVISSRETAVKTKNLRRDPRAWLCAVSAGWFGEWYQVSGDVEIISLPEAMDLLVEYYRTLSFVNALAHFANREDHHPDLSVHYDRCVVRFSTHDVGGLSENDFICAAKADALFD